MAKIVSISNHIELLISQAKENNRLAQKELFDMFSPKMLSICRYYIQDIHFAEDVMIKGFFKALSKIETFDQKSSFYTWLKRIVSNECIDFIRSKTYQLQFAEWDEKHDVLTDELQNELDYREIEEMIDELPDGSKIVFNLYVLEGMKHSEIAQKLQISIGTSKSQLAYARKCLQEKLKNQKQYHVES